jgi:hypothetical protein
MAISHSTLVPNRRRRLSGEEQDESGAGAAHYLVGTAPFSDYIIQTM